MTKDNTGMTRRTLLRGAALGALATPALVGGRVYVRTAEHLYAFGE